MLLEHRLVLLEFLPQLVLVLVELLAVVRVELQVEVLLQRGLALQLAEH